MSIGLEPASKRIEEFRICGLQCPGSRRRIRRVQSREVEGVRGRNERLDHELLPDVVHYRARKLQVARDLSGDGLAAVFAGRNYAGARERILWRDQGNSVARLPLNAVTACGVQLIFPVWSLGHDVFVFRSLLLRCRDIKL